MPWPGEDRQDVGSPARFQNLEGLPPTEGTIPIELPKEEYAPEEEEGNGVGDIQIEGTSETQMPFQVPQVESGGMGAGLPGLPDQPAGNLPAEQSEEGLSPDILPVQPFSIEGAEEGADETPALEEKPTSQNQLEAPLPETGTRIQLGEAPLPTSKPSSLVVHGEEIVPLPPTTSAPANAPAPMPNVYQPTSYPTSKEKTPSEPAPIYTDQETLNRTVPEASNSEAWRSRRTRSAELESAPLPDTNVPSEGRHVTYEQTPEAPMPEAIETTDVLETSMQLALEGYCPVELVLNERWIEGDPKWTATHKGRNYRFSSREAFDSFCRSPELYAPYYAGVDPIIALVGGGMLDGRTDLCAVYHGRLYMFSSQESLDQFRANPAQCVEAFEAHLKIE